MTRSFFGTLLLIAVSALVAACGGGGGGGGQSAGVSAEPATVGLVITDAVADEWDEARATITQVSLIGDGLTDALNPKLRQR